MLPVDKHDATVHDLLGEGSHVEAGDNTQVAAASFEGLEEPRVVVLVGVDYTAVGEDDLIVHNVIASKASLGNEERGASSEGETGDTNSSDTTACDAESMLFGFCQDARPS